MVLASRLKGKRGAAGRWQGKEQADPPIKNKESVTEGALDLICSAANRRRIGNAPMGGHRLTLPDRAHFFGGAVTDRKDEVKLGSSRPGEFIPSLASQACAGQTRPLELLQRLRSNLSRRMTSCTIGGECRLALVVQDRLGHDGPRRVSRAQKQNVVMCRHESSPHPNSI